jgi:hypothetical protein
VKTDPHRDTVHRVGISFEERVPRLEVLLKASPTVLWPDQRTWHWRSISGPSYLGAGRHWAGFNSGPIIETHTELYRDRGGYGGRVFRLNLPDGSTYDLRGPFDVGFDILEVFGIDSINIRCGHGLYNWWTHPSRGMPHTLANRMFPLPRPYAGMFITQKVRLDWIFDVLRWRAPHIELMPPGRYLVADGTEADLGYWVPTLKGMLPHEARAYAQQYARKWGGLRKMPPKRLERKVTA